MSDTNICAVMVGTKNIDVIDEQWMRDSLSDDGKTIPHLPLSALPGRLLAHVTTAMSEIDVPKEMEDNADEDEEDLSPQVPCAFELPCELLSR